MPTSSWTQSEKTRRIAGGSLAFAICTGTLMGFSGTASAMVPTEQSLEAPASPVAANSPLTFTGTLTGFNDQPVRNQTVDLEWRAGSDQPWAVSNSGTTDSNGVASIPATITSSAEWRINYHGDQIHDQSISPTTTVEAQKPANDRIVDAAAAEAGKPYSSGGTGPDSFDCSGLTKYVHQQVGIDLPRTSGEQRGAVPEISRGDMAPGDLIFFGNGGSVYHVGIYAGDNKMWAAPEPGDVVRLQDIWTDSYSVGRAW